jgi:hypothetical protein
MTPVQDCKSSHDVAVASITSYYTFLDRINSDDANKFEFPPPTGWPQFKRQLFPECTDAVVKLLCHIRYPAICGSGLLLMDETQVVDHNYHTNNLLRDDLHQEVQSYVLRNKRYMLNLDFELPPHVVPLTDGGRYGYGLLIDTEQGTIIVTKNDNEYPTRIYGDGSCYQSYHPEEGEDEDKDKMDSGRPWCWKRAPAFPIEESFEMCKEQFRNMNRFATLDMNGCSDVYQLREDQHWETAWETGMKRILTDCGWPGDGKGGGLDRESAVKEMKEMEHETSRYDE